MERTNGKVQLYAHILIFLMVWGLVLLVSQASPPWDLLESLKKVPIAIGIYAVLGLIFTKWLWRAPFLHPWLVKIPDLQGTWRGTIKSSWLDQATGAAGQPIPVVLTIKQDLLRLSCTLMTEESTSNSVAADINFGLEGDAMCLSYLYVNRPRSRLRERSPIQNGAAILKIVRKPSPALEGEYWTSRGTKGEMSLEFESRTVVERFSKPSNLGS